MWDITFKFADEMIEMASSAETTSKCYVICVNAVIPETWSAGFEGWEIYHTTGHTSCLRGFIDDQAALYGILKKIRDLGLPLQSLHCVSNGDLE